MLYLYLVRKSTIDDSYCFKLISSNKEAPELILRLKQIKENPHNTINIVTSEDILLEQSVSIK